MAAFNFPSSPSNGDTYSLNSVTYQYDGTKWVRYSASVGAQGAAGAQGATGSTGAQGALATINSNADNRVITGSGTANTLNAESTLTYDASLLNVTSTTQGLGLRLRNTSNEYTSIRFDAARTAASSALGILEGRWNNQHNVCQIYLQSGDDTTNKDDGRISMVVSSAAGSNKIAFRIEPDASVQLPNDSQKLQFGNDQDLNIWHGGSNGYIDNETGNLSFRTTSSNTERVRIRSDGSTHFYSPNLAWNEGPVVLEASNGYGAIFFRSTGNTHDTSSTGSWFVGKLNSTNGFAILKQDITGGGAVRGDAAIHISNAGDTNIGKYLAVGHYAPVTRLDVKQNNGVAYNNRVQTVAYGAARFFNESGHTSGGTYTGLQFNLTGDSQNRICSIGMISEASNSRNSSLVFATDDNGNRNEKLRISSSGHVTKPYNLCLQYTPSGSINKTSGTIVYATEVFDVGNSGAYDNSTGEFTAPVTGVYRIQYEHFSSGAGRATCAIEKNTGSGYSQVKRGMRVYSVSSGSNWASVPTIFYLQMNATDKFRIVHNEGTVHLNTPWNHMTVQLVQ